MADPIDSLLAHLPLTDIIEKLNDGVLIVNINGDVIYANPHMSAMLGYTPGEMFGKALFSFMTPEWAQRARQNLARRARGIEESFDHQFTSKSGAPVWAMVSTRPITTPDGETISLVAIRDISERIIAEEALRSLTDELEERVVARTRALEHEVDVRREAERVALEASETKSRLLANMSHELRTPLNAIIGYSELIIEEGTSTECEVDLNRILSSARHLLALVDGVLDLSKTEAGHMQLEPVEFIFDELLEEAIELVGPMLAKHGNDFTFTGGARSLVYLDRLKIKQVLVNLLSNASKFSPHGEISLTSRADDEHIYIEVVDTGVGIAANELPFLFEPFTQSSASTQTRTKGTGLGLAICKRYIEMMGGVIHVTSQLGAGSRFVVRLPLRRAHTSARREEMSQSTESKDGTQIAYRVVGQGAKTIVFVHGWMVSAAVFDPLVESLSALDTRLVLPDMRGAGDSASASDYSMLAYAEDIKAVIEAVGAEDVALIGHSMGGQIAQIVAAQLPDVVSQLVLMCPVPASGIPLPDDAVGLFSTSGQDREKQATILGLACLQLSDEAREELLDDAGEIDAECIKESFLAWSAGGFTDLLPAITAQTLVVGTDDPFLPPEFLDAAVVQPITDASFEHIPGPGHYPQLEAPELTIATLLTFLS